MGSAVSGIAQWRSPIEEKSTESDLSPEERKRLDDLYEAFLASAEQKLDEEIERNACPREELRSFRVRGYISSGLTSYIFIVEHILNGGKFALKVLRKKRIVDPDDKLRVIFEKKLQYAMRSDFLVKLFYAFQDVKNLYLCMELAKLGDLFRFSEKKSPERMAKLLTAQIVLGLEYMHRCNVAHRDLKPSNVFIFSDGYIKLGDFGLSKKVSGRSYSAIGTARYMAPEVFQQKGHGKAVDWWALGVMLHEFLIGIHPFCYFCKTSEQIFEIVAKKTLCMQDTKPSSLLIRGLLEKTIKERLGAGGPEEVKQHEWFNDISFTDLAWKRTEFMVNLASMGPKLSRKRFMLSRRIGLNPGLDGFEEF